MPNLRQTTPAVTLSAPAANLQFDLALGRDRWVLWTQGPPLGPAVLFWPMLLLLLPLAWLLARSRLTPLGFAAWFLLGVGLTQAPAAAGIIVVAWLLALGARAKWGTTWGRWRFNLAQLGLIALTGLALLTLFEAVHQGLLGTPAMQVQGYGSTAYHLHWYVDWAGANLPQATVWSAPLWLYRAVMLAWALWLALALLDWLRWGWHCLSNAGLWRSKPRAIATDAAVTSEDKG